MNQKIFDFDLNEIKNFDYILGIDEAGRGPGAGPVCSACVAFFNFSNLDKILFNLNDSKKITEKTREKLFPLIKENSFYSIKFGSEEEIKKINILNTTLCTMKIAALDVISKLKTNNVLVLVDGNQKIKDFNYPQKTIVKGDGKSASIAAASVLAKVSRDNFMIELDKKYPAYNFKKNKGYLTKEHIEAIKREGITEFHREKFVQKFL